MGSDQVHAMNVRESDAVNVVLRYLFKLDKNIPWGSPDVETVIDAATYLAERANDTLGAGVRPSDIPTDVPR